MDAIVGSAMLMVCAAFACTCLRLYRAGLALMGIGLALWVIAASMVLFG